MECRLEPRHQSAKFHFSHVKKFRNFEFERHGIRVYRAWDIGEGMFFSYAKLIEGVSVDLRLSLSSILPCAQTFSSEFRSVD